MDYSLDNFLENSAKARQVVGTWGFHSHMNFTRMSYQEANVWFFEQVFNFLRSFFGLVTPDNLELITYNATQRITRENLSQQTFLDELMLIMKGLKEHIWTLRLNLNIIGFIRTEDNPDSPTRLQIQEPCSFITWGGPDESGFQNYSVSYSLFSSTTLPGEHRMIWSLNQPILEKALQKWEAQSGRTIEVIDSSTGDLPVFEHGFREPAPLSDEKEEFNPEPPPTPFSIPPSQGGDFDFGL